MEQQIKWLWLGLLISSAGWLGYKWVDFQSQVSTGKITIESIRANTQNQTANNNTDTSIPSPNPTQANNNTQANTQPTDLPDIIPSKDSPSIEKSTNSIDNQFINIETDNFQILISLKGGTLSQLKLKKYPVSVQQKNVLTTLLKTGHRSYSLQSGLVSEQISANHHSQYKSPQNQYTLAEGQDTLTVPLTWEQDGIKITKIYTFKRNSHQIQLTQTVENQSDQTWQGSSYAQLSRAQPTEDGDTFIYTYTGSAWWSEQTGFEKIDFDEMANESPTITAQDGWLAMIQHYFVSIIIPPKDQENYFYTKKSNNQYIIGTVSPQKIIAPQQNHQFQDQIFIGPKNQEELVIAHPELSYAVDYGIFHIIAAPIFWVLKHIYDFFGNWAIAIILVTVLIKLLFFKLSEKSYRSMARMKLLAPRIQQLRERYSDDKQGMNQKMMQLYKEEKVNPLGGCLPVLVQIPVFISLYWVLIESVELRQAPFILWIEDLTIADPYFVMPIIMGITMFVQQRLNPPPADPMQQKVMQFLPVIFTVFFLFFPAGLVLYWIVNNILSISQQWYITKKIEQEKKASK
jgi:YidC/Oxa1 family membrane protein insertase